LRKCIFGLCALLGVGIAQAEPVNEPYAKVGDWEITAENNRECVMKRLYGSKVADEAQGLIVLYDARRKTAALSWASPKPKLPPLSTSLDFDLAFLKGSSLNESWGSQTFEIQKPAGAYAFIHVFTNPADVERILGDLASHEAIALFFGPTLMTGLPLDASDAVAKLRECASKLAERDQGALIPK